MSVDSMGRGTDAVASATADSPGAGSGREKPILYVGTIGHVDHGKSTLTSAMTAILSRRNDTVYRTLDTLDKLPEERRRNVTIRNAYCEFESPARRYIHVDCPGHANYVTQMVAGAHVMNVGILVVSAVEGPMPQTREHLFIARQAGVREIVVFLSMIDRVDDPELVGVVEAEVIDLLALHGYAPATVRILRGSARAALESPDDARRTACIEDLIAALDACPAGPSWRVEAPMFMPILDAVFVPGRGMVLVGRLDRGTVAVGDDVELVGAGAHQHARVRSIQSFRRPVERAEAGELLGLLVSGVGRGQESRGCVLAQPGSAHTSQFFWAEIEVLTAALGGRRTPVQNGYAPLFHFGTTAVPGILMLPKRHRKAQPGERLRARVRLNRPVVLEEGSKFLAREGGSTVLSGRVEQLLTAEGPSARTVLSFVP